MKNLFYLVCFLLLACSETEPEVQYNVPQEIQPYIDSFIQEGSQRGQTIIIDNLIVELTTPVNNAGNPVCGVTFGEVIGQKQNLIRIDIECEAWRAGGAAREVLIFHELAHAFLLRASHRNDKLPNFDFASLLVSETWRLDDFYIQDATKRTYYMDELFDPNTPVPDWAD